MVGLSTEDVIHYKFDIFVMGDDWEGSFDFMKSYCDLSLKAIDNG